MRNARGLPFFCFFLLDEASFLPLTNQPTNLHRLVTDYVLQPSVYYLVKHVQSFFLVCSTFVRFFFHFF